MNIQSARIEWQKGQPLKSLQFPDVYFSDDQGIDESRYVFLKHNGLPERWRNCSDFTIWEAGFGSGLNFMTTWQLWDQTAPPQARLHYLSVEKYPIERRDLERIVIQWAELRRFSEILLQAYPELIPGRHELTFNDGRIRLTLIFDDIKRIASYPSSPADAWFLDGFNPACNPDMWSEAVFRAVACRTRPGGTFATFTSAGFVKRGLRSEGFDVERVDGYGRKRHMLRGRFPGQTLERSPVQR